MSDIKVKCIAHRKDMDLVVMSRGEGPDKYKERPDFVADANKIARMCVVSARTNIIGIGGLEPFDTAKQTWQLCRDLRKITDKPIHIFTHYTKDECIKLHNREVYWSPITKKCGNICITYGDGLVEYYNYTYIGE